MPKLSRSLTGVVTVGGLSAVVAAGAAVSASGSGEHHQAGAVAQVVDLKSSGDLKTDIDAILADPALAGAKAGVVVREAKSGKLLYTRSAETSVTPASNQKLATTAAAFAILGPKYTFRTSVMSRAARKGTTLRGDLVLKGTGDPTMQAADYDRLAAGLAKKGVRRVTGRLVADDTWFDSQRVAKGWDPTDFPYSYAAQISALTMSPDKDFNAGSVSVDVSPGAEGQPVRVGTTPNVGYMKVDNKAVTGKAGSPSTLSVTRKTGTNVLTVTGSYPVGGSKYTGLYTVNEPELYAAAAFRKALKAHGVAVVGKTARGAAPKGSRTLAARNSMQLSKLATPYLKLSNNTIAEILVKAIGHKVRGKGTWAAGLPEVKRNLTRLGLNANHFTLTDGSGLSHSNKATAGQIVALLRATQRKPWFPTIFNALPIAGKPQPWVGGTLATRMVGTKAAGNVHAKTGTLTGASALSGWVNDPTGTRLTFSIVFNDYKATSTQVRGLQDKIAVRLAGGGAAQRMTIRTVQTGRDGLECSWTGTC